MKKAKVKRDEIVKPAEEIRDKEDKIARAIEDENT